MPVEFGLKFVAVVGANFSDPEWEFSNDVVYEIDGVGLRMLVIDFEGANTCCVVDGGKLKPSDILASLASMRNFTSI